MVNDTLSAVHLIQQLELEPLQGEGGYFKRIYRSSMERTKRRKLYSLIYYMIDESSFSSLHMIDSEEIWHFHKGDPAEQVRLYPDGRYERIIIGSDIEKGEVLVSVVPAGVWQGTRLLTGGSYALFGCTVLPEYQQCDYIQGVYEDVVRDFPSFSDIIKEFCIPEE